MKTKLELALAIIEQIRTADCIQFDDSPLLSNWNTIHAEELNLDVGDDIVISASWGTHNQCERSVSVTMLLQAMQNKSNHAGKLVFSTEEVNDSLLRFFELVPIQLDAQVMAEFANAQNDTAGELVLDNSMDILFWDGLPIITRNQLSASHEVNGPFEVLRVESPEWKYVTALGLVSGSDILYDRRVVAYEKTGMTRSDAQAVVDMENERGIQPETQVSAQALHEDLLAKIENTGFSTPGSWLRSGSFVYALDQYRERNRFSLDVQGGHSRTGVPTTDKEIEAIAKMVQATPMLFASNMALIRLLDAIGYEGNDPAYRSAIEAAKLATGVVS